MVKELFPYTPKYWDRDGLKLAYIDEGRGDPVVMVHGNPTWSFYYRELIDELRRDHRCIALDHIGCGRSDKPTADRYDYTLDSRVEDLDGLLKHLGIGERITLIVHDWGGMIGMAWAVRNARAIARIVVLNTAAFALPDTKPFPWTLRLTRSRLGEYLVLKHNAFCRGAARYCVVRKMEPAVREAFLAPYDSPANRIATLRFVQDIPLDPTDPAWPTLQATADNLHVLAGKPMVICWGEHDFIFDHHFRAEWERRFPDAEVHRYSHAGHYVLEDAGAQVRAVVRDLVDRERSQDSSLPEGVAV